MITTKISFLHLIAISPQGVFITYFFFTAILTLTVLVSLLEYNNLRTPEWLVSWALKVSGSQPEKCYKGLISPKTKPCTFEPPTVFIESLHVRSVRAGSTLYSSHTSFLYLKYIDFTLRSVQRAAAEPELMDLLN